MQPGRNHHAVDIHRHRVQTQAWDDLLNHCGIQRLQPFDRLHRESREPPTHATRRRQHLQPTKPQEHGVVSHIANVVQAAATDNQQPDQQAYHRDDPEVALQKRASERRPDPIMETARPQIPVEHSSPA